MTHRASSVLLTSALVMATCSLAFAGIGFAGTLIYGQLMANERLLLAGRTAIFHVAPALAVLATIPAMRRRQVWPTLLAMGIGLLFGTASGLSAARLAPSSGVLSQSATTVGLWFLLFLECVAGISLFLSGVIVLWQRKRAIAQTRGFEPTIQTTVERDNRE